MPPFSKIVFPSHLLFLFSLCILCNLPVSAATPSTNAQEENIAQLEKLFSALESLEKDIPLTQMQPDAILPLTGLTPPDLVDWIKNQTKLIPYQGALRNAQGVLMDRAGNSLDRSLLLQDMLRLLGYDTRLANAHLTAGQAKQLFNSPSPSLAAPPPGTSASDRQAQLARFGLDETQQARISEMSETAAQQQQTLQAALTRRVDAQTAALMAALEGSLPAPTTEDPQAIAALQDHWWVQYQENDAWHDLDPAGSLLKPAPPVAERTLAVDSMSALPRELLHRLQIKISLECSDGNTLTESVLVETPDLLPAELLGQPLTLNHVPVNMPANITTSDSAAFTAMLLKQNSWFPILSIGEKQFFTHDFTSTCAIGIAKPPDPGITVTNSLNTVLDVFAPATPPAAPTPAATTYVSAEWIEYVIHTPGGKDQIIRRQLFDMTGVANRAKGKPFSPLTAAQQLAWRSALLGDTAILVLPNRLPTAYMELLTSQNLLKNRPPLLKLLRNLDDPRVVQEAVAELQALPTQLYALATQRQQLIPPSAYLDGYNLLSYHRQMKTDAAGRWSSLEGFDIVRNDIATTAPDAFAIRLKQGVADTNLEALLAAANCTLPACPPITNTAELWEHSKAQNIRWPLVRTLAELKQLNLSPELHARIADDLATGHLVMVPEKPLMLGEHLVSAWWQIDPVTGRTLGMGENGWGNETAEYINTVSVIVGALSCTYTSSSSIGLAACAVAAVAGFGGFYAGGGSPVAGAIAALVGQSIQSALAVAEKHQQ